MDRFTDRPAARRPDPTSAPTHEPRRLPAWSELGLGADDADFDPDWCPAVLTGAAWQPRPRWWRAWRALRRRLNVTPSTVGVVGVVLVVLASLGIAARPGVEGTRTPDARVQTHHGSAVGVVAATPSQSALADTVSTATVVPTPAKPAGDEANEGDALYPDLIALPPADLYLSREVLADGTSHHLLRFSTTVANVGEGRLELRGAPAPGGGTVVWQHLYDAPGGGKLVTRLPVGADLVDHPQHRHVHFADFFGFTLMRQGLRGISWPLPGTNGKLSSCVFDAVLVDRTARESQHYRDCGPNLQGLSSGWGDIYDASLPDQWIDLGPDRGVPPLVDGTYTLRASADPLNHLDEGGREANNAAAVSFVVRDGRIVGQPEPARCTLMGAESGPVGATVTLSCAHFPLDALVEVHWDGPDPWAEPPLSPVAYFFADGATPVTVSFPVPEAPVGGHTVVAVTTDLEDAAAVIYAVEPDRPRQGP